MIAFEKLPTEPSARHIERGRTATRRRVRHARRRSYAAFVRVGGAAAVIVVPLMLYVMLTVNLTSANYALAHAQARKAGLIAETMRADDRIAKLESRERLAAIADRLGMHDPRTFAVVTLPPVPRTMPAPHGIALLGAINAWLNGAAGNARQ